MKNLLSAWPAIKKRTADKSILLFLDYDGTLSPIAKTPDAAKTPERALKLLKTLSKRPDIRLAIISGRSLSNISRRIGIRKIIYAGNHGLEIRGPLIKRLFKSDPSFNAAKKNIVKRLRRLTCGIKGMLIEDKGLTLAVHFKLSKKKDAPRIKKALVSAALPYLKKRSIRIKRGKGVREIHPPTGWNKGKAVLWILRNSKSHKWKRRNILPVYIGDDATDEDAFRALKGKGLTVFVGRHKKSQADYRLKNPGAVIKFLGMLDSSVDEK